MDQQATLAKVHSSEEEAMFATSTVSPFYSHCGLLENVTELITLHLLTERDKGGRICLIQKHFSKSTFLHTC